MKSKGVLSIAIGAAVIALTQFAAGTAQAASVTACATSITSCGCTITKAGTYTVANALTASQGLTAANGCIDVKASNVILFTNGQSITGSGTGLGIHLLKSAKNAFVEAVGAGEIGTSEIDSWDVAIQDDASNVIVEDPETKHNTTAGIVMNNVTGSNINDFDSEDNPIGVLLNHSNNNLVGCFNANNNTIAGAKLVNSNGNKIECFQAETNTVYGVWLMASSFNQIDCSSTNSNGNTGVYVGCHDSGPAGTACSGIGPSNGNRIYDHSAVRNTNAGIAIDLGDTGNIVTDVNATSNTGPDDMIDENASCDSDVWFGNRFNHKSQSCIQ